ncbi:hypothetical protein BDP27DRAFT_1419043 [Rhodocollybia butyracea]|uniref:Uncharacterized protein n=1 Tax=Rhodocollybia butyracea TaxID=206335 RepID=A0A9P5U9Z4_9AGAR|nr:hypothetical protein BDP27DRAFT_1419043 [Rhodocollybia butyracea]
MSGRSSLQIPSSTSSSSIPAHLTPLAALADPQIRHFDSAMMDYFLIEVVNTLRESSKVALNRERKREKERVEAGLILPPALPMKDNKDGTISARFDGGHWDARRQLSRDRALFTCKDIWVTCWDKQVDNLRTNHRGVYVLQDNFFKTISRLSSWQNRPDALTTSPQCTFQVKLLKGS